jgi:hypothetical protein
MGQDAAFHPFQVEGVAQSQEEDAGQDDEDPDGENDERQEREV